MVVYGDNKLNVNRYNPETFHDDDCEPLLEEWLGGLITFIRSV